jgi:hypothetical protein
VKTAAQCALLLAVLVSAAQGQIRGTPASVTSLGPHGYNGAPRGTPASVTSLGPQGYTFSNCSGPLIPSAMGCSPDITFPGSVDPRLQPPVRTHHRRGSHGGAVYVPVYVPYPVYAEEPPPEPVAEREPERVAPTIFERGTRVQRAEPRPELPPEPVAAVAPPREPGPQTSTVLVFRDGHRLEVGNYAIVGDTLYAFSDGLSRKIALSSLDLEATVSENDDRGVDFRMPVPRSKPAIVPSGSPNLTVRAAP